MLSIAYFTFCFQSNITVYTFHFFSKNTSTLPHGSLPEKVFHHYQLCFQGLLIYKLDKKNDSNYFEMWMTISLMGSLILTLLIIN
jgi:hypothetical protein